jgi:hypothetical protein
MGKKYEAYTKAVEANNAAKGDLKSVQGGSTQERLMESITNAQQAEIIEQEAWKRVEEDPEG